VDGPKAAQVLRPPAMRFGSATMHVVVLRLLSRALIRRSRPALGPAAGGRPCPRSADILSLKKWKNMLHLSCHMYVPGGGAFYC